MDVDVETAYATMLLCSFIESSSHLCLYHRILHAGDRCIWERCNKRLCIGTVLFWYACYMLLFEQWIVSHSPDERIPFCFETLNWTLTEISLIHSLLLCLTSLTSILIVCIYLHLCLQPKFLMFHVSSMCATNIQT